MGVVLRIGLVSVMLLLAIDACSKGSRSTTVVTSPQAALVAPSAAPVMNGAQASDGARVFMQNCSSCHQAGGQGIEGTFPPLAGNPVVTGDAQRVMHIVKFGLSGDLDALGHHYNGMMPTWDQLLSNDDIASVVTYIRSSWGNKASAVSAADVKAIVK